MTFRPVVYIIKNEEDREHSIGFTNKQQEAPLTV